jgi:hypothetical protein
LSQYSISILREFQNHPIGRSLAREGLVAAGSAREAAATATDGGGGLGEGGGGEGEGGVLGVSLYVLQHFLSYLCRECARIFYFL